MLVYDHKTQREHHLVTKRSNSRLPKLFMIIDPLTSLFLKNMDIFQAWKIMIYLI